MLQFFHIISHFIAFHLFHNKLLSKSQVTTKKTTKKITKKTITKINMKKTTKTTTKITTKTPTKTTTKTTNKFITYISIWIFGIRAYICKLSMSLSGYIFFVFEMA